MRHGDHWTKGRGFERIHAHGGPSDRVVFHHAADNDRLVANSKRTRLHGNGFLNLARGFERVFAFARAGGKDIARFQLDDRTAQFTARPRHATVIGTGYRIIARGFHTVIAAAPKKGNNRAVLLGSDQSDRLKVNPSHTVLRAKISRLLVRRFARVVVRMVAGRIDAAVLNDSPSNDRFQGYRNKAFLTSNSYNVRVINPSKITLVSKPGGNDQLHIQATDYVLQTIGLWTWHTSFRLFSPDLMCNYYLATILALRNGADERS